MAGKRAKEKKKNAVTAELSLLPSFLLSDLLVRHPESLLCPPSGAHPSTAPQPPPPPLRNTNLYPSTLYFRWHLSNKLSTEPFQYFCV